MAPSRAVASSVALSVGGARVIGVGDVERGGERAETGDVSRAVAGGDLPGGDVARAVLGARGTHPCRYSCPVQRSETLSSEFNFKSMVQVVTTGTMVSMYDGDGQALRA